MSSTWAEPFQFVTPLGTHLALSLRDKIYFNEDGVEKSLPMSDVDEVLTCGVRKGDYIEYNGESYKYNSIYAIQSFRCSIFKMLLNKDLINSVKIINKAIDAPIKTYKGIRYVKMASISLIEIAKDRYLQLNNSAIKVLCSWPNFNTFYKEGLKEELEFVQTKCAFNTEAGLVKHINGKLSIGEVTIADLNVLSEVSELVN